MKGHKNNILIVLLLLTTVNFSFAQIITVSTDDSGEPMKFAQHYGDNIFLIRNVDPNDFGKYVIYNDSLQSGMYYLIMSDSSTFEFLYDRDYQGKIEVNYNSSEEVFMLITAPSLTAKFFEFQTQNNAINKELSNSKTLLRQSDLKNKEKRELQSKREQLLNRSDSLINTLAKEYKGSVLGSMMLAKTKVEVPVYKGNNKEVNNDSAAWVWRTNYYKKHYLDNFNLNDQRLIRTPMYTSTLNKYLDKVSSQQPDELCKSIDFVLNKTEKDSKVDEFVSDYLLNKYNKLKNDANYEYVYLHIIEKHYLRSGASWLSNDDIAKLSQDYNVRKPLLIGQKAPNIKIDSTIASLYEINSKNTLVYFFNYDCAHCNTVTKELKKISVKKDTTELVIYAVCLGTDHSTCKKYISGNGLSQWQCSSAPNRLNKVASEYNLSYTPTLFLLDAEKNIISKNFTINQLKKLLKE